MQDFSGEGALGPKYTHGSHAEERQTTVISKQPKYGIILSRIGMVLLKRLA